MMFTTTMNYSIKPERQEDFCTYWNEEVLSPAKGQPGLVRMMLLESNTVVMALGVWKDRSYAEDFMKTGVFKDLMAHIADWLTEDPKPLTWDMNYFI